MARSYWVYVMTNAARTLCVGVTSDPLARVLRHRQGTGSTFTARYRLTQMVYLEEAGDPHAAISREKQLKSWVRRRKVALIEAANPEWKDLAADWYGTERPDPSLRSGSLC